MKTLRSGKGGWVCKRIGCNYGKPFMHIYSIFDTSDKAFLRAHFRQYMVRNPLLNFRSQ